MRDPFKPDQRGSLGQRLMEIDAYVNSAVYRLFGTLKSFYTDYSARLERFNYRGLSQAVLRTGRATRRRWAWPVSW